MKKIIFSFLLASFASAIFAQKIVPSIDVKTLEGKTVSSAALTKRGKVTVLSFWATWCAPCKKELDAITKHYAQWQTDYSVEIVAVTIDDAQGLPKVKPMIAQKGWKYTVLSDANKQFMQSLGIQGVPYTIVLDKKGNIVYEHNGYKAGDETELENKIKEYAEK